MYLEHFGLSAPPFQFTASPMALFMSRTHREALAALEWGLLHEPSGLTLLIGESGTGKTTLVCALLARQYREVRAAYLGNPKLGFEDLLGSILSQLGVRGGRGNKSAMINAFAHFALDLPLTERIAILIDEAQALNDDALEEFRLLSNLERHGRKAAQIVLAGQFELARRLAEPAMRHLNERIGARAVLLPLTALECRQYIEHRLHLCHASSEKIFASRALDYIVRQSAGVPRRINALCHNSLLLAYSGGVGRVTLAMAKEAAADYAAPEQASHYTGSLGWLREVVRQGARSLRPVLGLGLLGAAGFVSGHLVMNHNPVRHLRSLAAHTAPAPDAAPVPVGAIAPKIEGYSPKAPAAARPKSAGGESLVELNVVPAEVTDSGSESGVEDASLAAPVAPAAPTAPAAPAAPAAPEAPASMPAKPPVASPSAAVPAAAAAPDSARPFVVVARGETLSEIALRRLGSAYSVRNLMRVNPHITDAARVYPGEIVYLPPSSAAIPKPIDDDSDVE